VVPLLILALIAAIGIERRLRSVATPA